VRMKRESTRSVVIVAAALFCASASVGAQPRLDHRAGTRWKAGAVILVLIDSRGAPAGAEAIVERAMTTWTEAAGGRFTLRKTTARGEANVRVQFVPGNRVYGETLPRLDLSGEIVSADVRINGDVVGDPMDRRIVVYLTALHELGHAIGLPHTDEFTDIMYSFRRPDDGERYFGAYRQRLRTTDDIGSARATGLSAGDQAALRALYKP
jgi:matrixin